MKCPMCQEKEMIEILPGKSFVCKDCYEFSIIEKSPEGEAGEAPRVWLVRSSLGHEVWTDVEVNGDDIVVHGSDLFDKNMFAVREYFKQRRVAKLC